ncbi:hypothetical protein HPB47_006108 [Ixodes persulcatus]|uniref:Uncharacterized protein n=1 Tax=Ixodes persulcatus TaxID=34615 RepID=A0AC60PC30_IXOPE|nr:hypothetical protein HPB47_006108 [Ixodes persulcatus]
MSRSVDLARSPRTSPATPRRLPRSLAGPAASEVEGSAGDRGGGGDSSGDAIHVPIASRGTLIRQALLYYGRRITRRPEDDREALPVGPRAGLLSGPRVRRIPAGSRYGAPLVPAGSPPITDALPPERRVRSPVCAVVAPARHHNSSGSPL